MAVVGRVGASSVFIFFRVRAPRGAVKSLGPFRSGPVAKAHASFRAFPEFFFDAGLDPFGKIAAKFRVGGVAHG
jgi:hypothetical protein